MGIFFKQKKRFMKQNDNIFLSVLRSIHPDQKFEILKYQADRRIVDILAEFKLMDCTTYIFFLHYFNEKNGFFSEEIDSFEKFLDFESMTLGDIIQKHIQSGIYISPCHISLNINNNLFSGPDSLLIFDISDDDQDAINTKIKALNQKPGSIRVLTQEEICLIDTKKYFDVFQVNEFRVLQFSKHNDACIANFIETDKVEIYSICGTESYTVVACVGSKTLDIQGDHNNHVVPIGFEQSYYDLMGLLKDMTVHDLLTLPLLSNGVDTVPTALFVRQEVGGGENYCFLLSEEDCRQVRERVTLK